MQRIVLIAASSRPLLSDVEHLHGDVCACDFYIDGAQHWTAVPGGWQDGRFVNVDHHAPHARMERHVSSANLALERRAAAGVASGTVVVNHTDCDSILSAGIMSGRLDPLPEYGDAAIAADHTGDANPIADLLQSLDDRRCLTASFDSLERLQAGRPLPTDVQAALDRRLRLRDRASAAIADNRVVIDDGIAVGRFDEAIDGEFFPALLPDVHVILLFSPWLDDPSRHEVKVRLGRAAPAGVTLHRLWGTVDPVLHGRWNAGSNKRGGGSNIAPERYVETVRRLLADHATRRVATTVHDFVPDRM